MRCTNVGKPNLGVLGVWLMPVWLEYEHWCFWKASWSWWTSQTSLLGFLLVNAVF